MSNKKINLTNSITAISWSTWKTSSWGQKSRAITAKKNPLLIDQIRKQSYQNWVHQINTHSSHVIALQSIYKYSNLHQQSQNLRNNLTTMVFRVTQNPITFTCSKSHQVTQSHIETWSPVWHQFDLWSHIGSNHQVSCRCITKMDSNWTQIYRWNLLKHTKTLELLKPKLVSLKRSIQIV